MKAMKGQIKTNNETVYDCFSEGESMKLASGEFAEDPCSSMKRGNMVRAARALLSAVTHLLVLADMADVYQLLLQLKLVRRMQTHFYSMKVVSPKSLTNQLLVYSTTYTLPFKGFVCKINTFYSAKDASH